MNHNPQDVQSTTKPTESGPRQHIDRPKESGRAAWVQPQAGCHMFRNGFKQLLFNHLLNSWLCSTIFDYVQPCSSSLLSTPFLLAFPERGTFRHPFGFPGPYLEYREIIGGRRREGNPSLRAEGQGLGISRRVPTQDVGPGTSTSLFTFLEPTLTSSCKHATRTIKIAAFS